MTLDKDMINEPQMWQLVMEPDSDTLSVMVFSPIEHHSLISADIPLEKGMTPLKSFQEGVYNNPLLLSDFKKVTILLPAERFMLVPDILTDRKLIERTFHTAFPDADADGPSEIIIDELPQLKARLLTSAPTEFLNYLRRTFNNPRICHSLTPLALYFRGKHPNRGKGKMLVNLRGSRCDVIILGDEAPLVMNSFKVNDPMDSVYYIMACREGANLTPTDEIILAGDPATRAAVTPHLRRFVRYVMPAIFPSTMFRAGRAALRTPFELVVSPVLGIN
jgi:hypothetical protein